MASNKEFCFLELDVHTPKGKCKAFLQPGFFPRASATNRYHKHGYAEVHVGLSGESVFSSDGEHYVLKKGQLLTGWQKIRILLIIDGVEIALYTKILETWYNIYTK